MTRTVAAGLEDLRGRLIAAGIDSAATDARRIMARALGVRADRISLMQTDPLPDQAEDRLAGLAARRCAREPLSHILGLRAFYDHEFRVTADVLDPRPETEVLVRAGLAVPFDRVLDLGTGSGCILLSLLAARAGATGVGADLSGAALDVAKDNADRLDLTARVDFVQSDWLANVDGSFDLIVSNPPYIAAAEMPALDPEIAFEPRMALTDEGDGLAAYRALIPASVAQLRPNGWLMVETGWTQGPAVAGLMQTAGLSRVTILPDLDQRDRVVQGCLFTDGS